MLKPTLRRSPRTANILIIAFSIIVFGVVVALGRMKPLEVDLPFNPHLFGAVNAGLNSIVSVLLVVALVMVRQKAWVAHRNVMLVAMVLSILFLVSYITHKLLSGESVYGDMDGDGALSVLESASIGGLRSVYLFILITHITLAATILPFILFTAYRGLTGEYARHKKISRWTWPLWLYVSITGVAVYFFISPYYH